MPLDALQETAERYARDGLLSPVRILSAAEVARHRATVGRA